MRASEKLSSTYMYMHYVIDILTKKTDRWTSIFTFVFFFNIGFHTLLFLVHN